MSDSSTGALPGELEMVLPLRSGKENLESLREAITLALRASSGAGDSLSGLPGAVAERLDACLEGLADNHDTIVVEIRVRDGEAEVQLRDRELGTSARITTTPAETPVYH